MAAEIIMTAIHHQTVGKQMIVMIKKTRAIRMMLAIRGYSNDHSYNQQDRRYDERNHQADVDRINREYDQRIGGYRNDRSINSRERERRISIAERERQQKVSSFGGGVAVGAIAGVLLGVLLSH
jgi:hypothetical protein